MHHFPQGTYFEPRQTQEDLCRDFPADSTFIGGLERMQHFFSNRNQPIRIPILRTMNLAHTIIAYMFSNECLDQYDYDYIAYDGHGHDDQLKIITLIVVAAMLARTDNSFRATVCRDLVLDRRPQDFYEGVTLYDDFLRSTEKRFTEEDFLFDIPALVAQNQRLQYDNDKLSIENTQLKYSLTKMEDKLTQINQPNNQGTIYNAPVYITYTVPVGQTSPAPEPEETTPEFFCRITDEARKTGKAQAVENELRTACVSAPKLIKAIRTNEALGYLDTQNLSSKDLYELLDEHFHLSFKLRTFQDYRSK